MPHSTRATSVPSGDQVSSYLRRKVLAARGTRLHTLGINFHYFHKGGVDILVTPVLNLPLFCPDSIVPLPLTPTKSYQGLLYTENT